MKLKKEEVEGTVLERAWHEIAQRPVYRVQYDFKSTMKKMVRTV